MTTEAPFPDSLGRFCSSICAQQIKGRQHGTEHGVERGSMRDDVSFYLWGRKREAPCSANLAVPEELQKGSRPSGRKSLCRKLKQPKIALFLLGAVLAFDGASRARAAAVTYTATNLSGSEWRYDYTLAGSYTAGQDLAIYFPYATNSSLTDLGTGGPTWTTFVLQTDTALSANGEFDIMANVNSPSGASSLDYRVEPFELAACLGRGELPIDALAGGIPLLIPGLRLTP
jgi:hypothetical protein